MPGEPIDGEDVDVETAEGLGCRVGTAVVAAEEAVGPLHRQPGSRPKESNRLFEVVVDAEVDMTVDELQLGWRIGMCQVPVGCHMSIAGDDGKDPKR